MWGGLKSRRSAPIINQMPTNEDFDPDYLNGPARDPRTGAPKGTGSPPLTDADRELRKLLERERWIGAISVPPPAPKQH